MKLPMRNKGTSFTHAERAENGTRGLFPGGEPIALDLKVDVAMAQLRSKSTNLERYIFLHTIQDSDETLYHACINRHLIEVMPFVYTPTVGEACQKWSHIHRGTVRGIYISLNDKGSIRSILDNYPSKDIQAIVVTDGEAILGLGDLGANGMGISIGKLALYTGCAGVHPDKCLPVHIDVGTNNQDNLADPAYLGLRQERVRGEAFYSLVAEFMDACKDAYGANVLIQFEDFGNATCFNLLEQHRMSSCCFNDDVQGTASVVLGGLISAFPLTTGKTIANQTYVFYGAGAAGVGIADLIATAIVKDSAAAGSPVTLEDAKKRIWLVDSRGLVSAGRPGRALDAHKAPYAHEFTGDTSKVWKSDSNGDRLMLSVVEELQPSVLIGVSGQPGSFNEAVCRAMARINDRPVIFALSNPTTLCECSPLQAYTWTSGRCIYSSGSPFGAVDLEDGQHFEPGQGNNAYIFPGVGLGAILAGGTIITDDDFFLASTALASMVGESDLARGSVYPGLERSREVAAGIACAVAESMWQSGRATKPRPDGDLMTICRDAMYVPKY